MANNFVHPGKNIVVTATADTASGSLLIVGDLAAVALVDIPANGYGSAAICGVYALPKTAMEITIGTKVYMDDTGIITTVATDNPFAGIAVAGVASSASTVDVLLNGLPA